MRTGRTRSHALMVMLSEKEKSLVAKEAEARGMTMSAYARYVLLQEAKHA